MITNEDKVAPIRDILTTEKLHGRVVLEKQS